MGMKIWKFVLALGDSQLVPMPKDATMLSIQVQKSNLCMWALCNEDAEVVERRINIYGTGNPLPDYIGDFKFLATFQIYGGDLVFHAFEVPL